jgi:hypothetical protein
MLRLPGDWALRSLLSLLPTNLSPLDIDARVAALEQATTQGNQKR